MKFMTLGKNISSIRKSKGISQEMLAENSKVSLRTIQRLERDISVPRPYTLKVIAEALGVGMEQLTSRPTDPPDVQCDAYGLSKLRMMNLMALAMIVVPLGNVLLPLLIWNKNNEMPVVADVGGRIITFQILWTVASLLLLACGQAIFMGMEYNMIGRFPPTIIFVYIFLVLVNIGFIFRAAASLNKANHRIYSFVPNLL